MDFWNKDAGQLAVDRRRKAKDLWQTPPAISSEVSPAQVAPVSLEDGLSLIFEAMRSYRVFGHWAGLLPIQGVLGDNPHLLHFRWQSKQIIVFLIFIVSSLAVISYRIYAWIRYSIFGNVESAAYITAPLFWGLFTLRQATKFPKFMKKLVKVERDMRAIGHLHNLKAHLNVITALNIFATIGALVCVHVMWYQRVESCSEDFIVKIQLTFISSFKNLFQIPVHKLSWGPPIAFFIQTYCRTVWMFSELTFMVLSYCLYQLFKLYCDHLEKFRDKDTCEQFWYEMRVRYNSLSRLTKALDDFLSPNAMSQNTCEQFWYEMRVRYNSLSRLTKALDDFLSPNAMSQDTCEQFWYEMRVRYNSLSRLTKALDDFLSPNAMSQDTCEQFWYEMRVRYNSLSRLTKALDDFLSPNVCVTFAVDIFFICYALLYVFTKNPLNNLMLVYLLLYAVVRTLAIALLASYIHDLGKRPLSVLYHVPSQSYCSEALRFQMEILADDISLTGCRFFSITRSFIMANNDNGNKPKQQEKIENPVWQQKYYHDLKLNKRNFLPNKKYGFKMKRKRVGDQEQFKKGRENYHTQF